MRSSQLANEANSWVENLAIKTNNPENPVQTLSGGNQQKVVLSRWLATDLSLLILDGPTVGVDIGAKFDIYSRIRQLASQGLSVIIISDDLPEILYNCNRILVIRNGEITKELKAEHSSEKELAELATQ